MDGDTIEKYLKKKVEALSHLCHPGPGKPKRS
jgi:hypothetical protein